MVFFIIGVPNYTSKVGIFVLGFPPTSYLISLVLCPKTQHCSQSLLIINSIGKSFCNSEMQFDVVVCCLFCVAKAYFYFSFRLAKDGKATSVEAHFYSHICSGHSSCISSNYKAFANFSYLAISNMRVWNLFSSCD